MARFNVSLFAADSFLREVVERLVVIYEPEKVYLFGSRARGDAGQDSDYDLLVIVPDTTSAERRRSRLAYEALWELGRAGDILVYAASAFARRAHLAASLPATVLREGKLLYAA